MKSLNIRVYWAVAMLLLVLTPLAAQAEVLPYSEDFESLDINSTTALGDAGWVVWANVFAPDGVTFLYDYGQVYPAPNNPALPAFSLIAAGQGGVDQGDQQLSIISDYENTDHAIGNRIETNVYREGSILTGDTGFVYTLYFDAKRGELAGASTAGAFIKTIDPGAGYATTNHIALEMTATDTLWTGYNMSLTVPDSLSGQLLQIGFTTTASNYDPSSIYYDNVVLTKVSELADVPQGSVFAGAELRQNYPNPFNPMTRIDFSVDKSGAVELAVFDLAGRRVSTLQQGYLAAGDHYMVWNGRNDAGAPVSSGRYNYVLRTATGLTSRSMILLK